MKSRIRQHRSIRATNDLRLSKAMLIGLEADAKMARSGCVCVEDVEFW